MPVSALKTIHIRHVWPSQKLVDGSYACVFLEKLVVRTVLAVQVRSTKDVKLAADRRGKSTADRALTGDELANRGGARADSGGGGKAQKSGEGGECELHCGRSGVEVTKLLFRCLIRG